MFHQHADTPREHMPQFRHNVARGARQPRGVQRRESVFVSACPRGVRVRPGPEKLTQGQEAVGGRCGVEWSIPQLNGNEGLQRRRKVRDLGKLTSKLTTKNLSSA